MNPMFSDDIYTYLIQHIKTKQHRSKNGTLRNPTHYASVSQGVFTKGDKMVSTRQISPKPN